MAMSLEDLLVDEGFKGRKSKTITRASTGIRAESPVSDRVKGRRSIDVVGRLKNDARERHVRSSSEDMQGVRSMESSKQSSIDGIVHLNGFSGNYQKSVKQLGSSSSRSSITQNKVDKQDSRVRGPVSVDQSGSELALDKRFINNQGVRTLLHDSCLDVLNFTEGKVISNLKEAIKIVERAADEHADAKELKNVALQLSVITGLSANDMKDGFTNGISNSVLSACGHLYLSVIYHIQKKERVAARHLLQVFIDSPFSARTKLAPELWENIFNPHLLHLDEWYNREVDSLADDAGNTRKLKKVKKLYDEIVDVGTYEFALYYKNWLTDGVEAPTIPTINAPLVSLKGIQQGVKRSDDSRTSLDGSLVEDKMTVRHSLENEYIDFHITQYGESDQQRDERSVAFFETYDAHPQIEARPIGGGKGRFSCDIPHDYVCPLTGLLFKDPVTLENGQTYEPSSLLQNGEKDVQQFSLDGVQKESILSSMHMLKVYLESCSPAQRPLVAVLLLHLDLMSFKTLYTSSRRRRWLFTIAEDDLSALSLGDTEEIIPLSSISRCLKSEIERY
ncbi:zinc finger, RING/FYVE/PHD-type, armadillo-type fold protein [Tanacetum coccineum]